MKDEEQKFDEICNIRQFEREFFRVFGDTWNTSPPENPEIDQVWLKRDRLKKVEPLIANIESCLLGLQTQPSDPEVFDNLMIKLEKLEKERDEIKAWFADAEDTERDTKANHKKQDSDEQTRMIGPIVREDDNYTHGNAKLENTFEWSINTIKLWAKRFDIPISKNTADENCMLNTDIVKLKSLHKKHDRH